MSAAPKIPHSQRLIPRRNHVGSVGVLAGGEYLVEQTLSVGEGGMMITTERAIAVGDQVVVSFSLGQNSEIIIVRARVRAFHPSRTTEEGRQSARLGLEFIDLTFTNKRAIRNFVARTIEA